VVTTFVGNGGVDSVDGIGLSSSVIQPAGLAIDTNGYIYLAEFGGNRIRKISTAGLVTTLAGSGNVGTADGTGTAASFSYPWNIAVDANSNLYLTDTSAQ
jgi:sugar lactone lactonase YvrE